MIKELLIHKQMFINYLLYPKTQVSLVLLAVLEMQKLRHS